MFIQTVILNATAKPKPSRSRVVGSVYKTPHYEILPNENVSTFGFEWIVPGPRPCVNETLQSPEFRPDANGQLKCFLLLDHWNIEKMLLSNCSVYLCLEACSRADVTAEFELGVHSLVDGRYYKTSGPCTFQSGTDMAIFRFLMFTDSPLKLCSVNVPIRCNVKVYKSGAAITKSNEADQWKVPDARLLDDIRLLWDNPKYTDFTLIVDRQEFPVHKAILSARSAVFSAMFEHDTQEQRDNQVHIKDATPEVIKEILRFIYTDSVMNIETVADELITMADKYALDRLKIMCENALRQSLTPQNAARILTLADLYSPDRLKVEAINYINRNLVEVLDSEEFKKMAHSNPELVVQILRASATKRLAN